MEISILDRRHCQLGDVLYGEEWPGWTKPKAERPVRGIVEVRVFKDIINKIKKVDMSYRQYILRRYRLKEMMS